MLQQAPALEVSDPLLAGAQLQMCALSGSGLLHWFHMAV